MAVGQKKIKIQSQLSHGFNENASSNDGAVGPASNSDYASHIDGHTRVVENEPVFETLTSKIKAKRM